MNREQGGMAANAAHELNPKAPVEKTCENCTYYRSVDDRVKADCTVKFNYCEKYSKPNKNNYGIISYYEIEKPDEITDCDYWEEY